MIKCVEGIAGLLHKIAKPAAWRRGTQILKKEEEDAASIPKKVSEVCSGKLVAETLITEFKVYLSQQFRKKTPIAQKS